MIITDARPLSDIYTSDVARLLLVERDVIIAQAKLRITATRREAARLAAADKRWDVK